MLSHHVKCVFLLWVEVKINLKNTAFNCDPPILRWRGREEVEEWVLKASWPIHTFSSVPHPAGCWHCPGLTHLPFGWYCQLLFHSGAGSCPPKVMWSGAELENFPSTCSSSLHHFTSLPQVGPQHIFSLPRGSPSFLCQFHKSSFASYFCGSSRLVIWEGTISSGLFSLCWEVESLLTVWESEKSWSCALLFSSSASGSLYLLSTPPPALPPQ